jgi:hypothetical protein
MHSVPRPAKSPPVSHSVQGFQRPGLQGTIGTRGDPPETEKGALREFNFHFPTVLLAVTPILTEFNLS